MKNTTWSQWLGRLRNTYRGTGSPGRKPAGRRAARSRLEVERLEARDVPAALTYVNDTWHLFLDLGAPGLSVGDFVTNANDSGPLTAYMYGVQAFGTVTTGVGITAPTSVAGAATIDDALANTDTFGTVNVLEGTYNERVSVDKTVSLLGKQAGVDARTGRVGAAESIIDGSTLGGAVNVSSNGVIIDGFTIQGDASFTADLNTGITAVGGGEGLSALNNIIQNVPIGISPRGADNVIQFNLIRNTIAGPAGQTGIYTDFGLSNTLIDSNAFTNNANAAIILTGSAPGAVTTTVVSNNQADNSIQLYFNTGTAVTGNRVTNSAGHGFVVGGGDTNIAISNNTVSRVGSGFSGVRVGDFIGNQPNTDVSIQNNILATGAEFGIRVGASSYTGTLNANFNSITGTAVVLSIEDAAVIVNASSNYWGTSDPATVQGRIAGAGAANVDFTPLLGNNETVANQSVVGFQPDLSAVTVHALGAQTGTNRIREGIDLVTAGGTVTVASGSYTGGADATAGGKGITLSIGSGPGQVTIAGDLKLDSNDTLRADVNNSTAGTGYDQLIVNGTVTLNNAALLATGTRAANGGDVLVLIRNDGVDAVTGTVQGQPEGSTIVVNGVSYRLTYTYNAEAATPGNGNDLALVDTTATVVVPPSGTPGETVGGTTATPAASSAITGATIIGNFLVLNGPNGQPFAIVPVPSGSFVLFVDVNGDRNRDVVLFTPTAVFVLDGATGRFLALSADVTGDGRRELFVFSVTTGALQLLILGTGEKFQFSS